MSSLSSRGEFYKYLAPAYKNFIIARRNFFTIFEVLFWPFIGLVSIGLLTSFLELEKSFTSFILIGAITLSVLQVSQIDVAYVLLFEMWSKSMKHVFVAPVGGRHLILGGLIFGAARGFLVFLVMAIISGAFFGLDVLAGGLIPVALFLFGVYLMAAITGMLVCVAILTWGYRAEIAAWTVTGIMMFLCGIYYPVSVLPAPLEALARLVPLTYYLEYFRSIYGFGGHNIGLGIALGLAYFLLELVAFDVALRRARSTGMILKLSE